jgi:Mg-chelatase subunit ChlD
MKTLCNLILVDASGSMQNRVSDVKGGLMKLFSDIKQQTGINQHTIVCDFSNDFNVLINTVDSKLLTADIIENYKTRGSTSLFDAIKKSFELIPSGVDGVFVSIITDGEENSSKECTSIEAKKLISKGKENRWGITFMGCDEKALDVAKNIGINDILYFSDTSLGYEKASIERTLAYQTYTSSVMSANSTDDIKSDGLFTQKS